MTSDPGYRWPSVAAIAYSSRLTIREFLLFACCTTGWTIGVICEQRKIRTNDPSHSRVTQSDDASEGRLRKERQTARLSSSTLLSQAVIWFQLANVRVTKSSAVLPAHGKKLKSGAVGAVRSNRVVGRDAFREEQLTQSLLVVKRGLHPQAWRAA